jgi:putative PIN family toxin of toxin-antitoxin system
VTPVVFDTNLIVSGLLWSGSPRQVLRLAADNRVQALTSEALIDELRDVLRRDKFDRYFLRLQKTPDALVNAYLSYAQVIEPQPVPEDAIRDKKDIKVLEAALGGQASYIVSGDNDLLTLKHYARVEILSVQSFLQYVMKDDKA